jgi:energy-coupling factor transporter transmembrane protein EcfT
MAEVAFLHYRPDQTLLHRTPGTIKLLGLMGFSILIYQMNTYGLVATGFLLISAALMAKPVLRKMKGALLFALLMAVLLGVSHFRQTGKGEESLVRVVRFLQIYFLGIVITTVTDPGELGWAFYILTRWIPFFPAKRLKTLVTLTLLFLPLIMDESLTVDRAAKCRCFHRRKNPVIRLKYRVEPLIEGIFRKSEEISRAMAARCYGE